MITFKALWSTKIIGLNDLWAAQGLGLGVINFYWILLSHHLYVILNIVWNCYSSVKSPKPVLLCLVFSMIFRIKLWIYSQAQNSTTIVYRSRTLPSPWDREFKSWIESLLDENSVWGSSISKKILSKQKVRHFKAWTGALHNWKNLPKFVDKV